MVQALHLDFHIEAVRRDNSTFFSEFSTETHKLEVMPIPQDSTMETGMIPAGETGIQ
jgi:hypothetical protein